MPDREHSTPTLGVLTCNLRLASHKRALVRRPPGLAPDYCRLVEMAPVGGLPESVAVLSGQVDGTGWPAAGDAGVQLASVRRVEQRHRLACAPAADALCRAAGDGSRLPGRARDSAPLQSLGARILARPGPQTLQVRSRRDPVATRITDAAAERFVRERLAAFAGFAAVNSPAIDVGQVSQ